jgi:hypothetical protein
VHAFEGVDHRLDDLATERREHPLAVDVVTEHRRLRLEAAHELGPVDVAALEVGPRVRIRLRRVEPPDRAVGQAGLTFVRREGGEGAREEHATHVEQDGADHGRDGTGWHMSPIAT